MSSGKQRDHRSTAAGIVSLALLAAVAHFSGCGLSTQGTRDSSGQPCDTAAQCDDKNPCTEKVCTDQKLCSITPKTSGGPDDANDCTVDACTDGVESHAPQSDGASCKAGLGTGICTAGACVVKCTSNPICDDQNSCTTDSCDLGSQSCNHGKLDGADPGIPAKAGDCKTAVCVKGVPKVLNDDTDLPEHTICQSGTCTAGVPAVANLAAQTNCGPKLECDGNGVCTGCVKDSECTVPNTCQVPACVKGSCIPHSVPAGTVPPDQQLPNDCQKVVCDGNGNANPQPDPTDLPPTDNNACTTEKCAGDVPVHDPLPNIGVPCQGGFCDNSGSCVACVSDANCDDNSKCTTDSCVNAACVHVAITCNDNNACTTDTCAPASGCSFVNNTNSCDDGNACTTLDTCGSGACTGTAVVCTAKDQCHDVGVCNGGTCSNPPKANGSGCDDGNACTGGDACTNGTCAGTAKNCDDSIICTIDACVAGSCTHAPDVTKIGQACGGSASCPDTTHSEGAPTCNAAGACKAPNPVACGGAYQCANMGICESCSDGVQNGNETDQDCGGGAPCNKCGLNKSCNGGSDCMSTHCTGMPKICTP